ncbi:50S ribosomal protein L9 [Buchnera aphidicola (Ceratoglyphina bambusae)]|uniref:50S ribosomal protein L9 n=1 Tax=Buchnera aphidicola TaxID=9 RepID=UPI0031B80E90
MKIILYKNVDNLGKKGKIVVVKPGYARNFLFPYGYAILASKNNIKIFKNTKKLEKKELKNKIRFYERIKYKLDKVKHIKIFAKSSKEGKLFGSVSIKNILECLNKNNIKVDKKNIRIEEGYIKKLGKYNIIFKFTKSITSKVCLEVLPK